MQDSKEQASRSRKKLTYQIILAMVLGATTGLVINFFGNATGDGPT
jgi:Na+/H+-dicarboxylate symporter